MRRQKRAISLLEAVVATSVLFLMVSVTAAAVIGYLRSYRIYCEQGQKLQRASSTLEAICRHLRTAKSVQLPVPFSLRQGNLGLVDRQLGSVQMHWNAGKVAVGTEPLGPADDVQFEVQPGFLQVTVPIGNAAPLRTWISMRGLRR